MMPPRLGHRTPLLGFLLAVAVTFSSCVSHRPYWTDKPTAATRIGQQRLYEVRQAKNYKWYPVEFDDKGGHWNLAQRREALALVKDGDRPPLVVAFIHGWHNNARNTEDNHDLKSFHKLLEKLATAQSKYRVVGAFIGWRGESVSKYGAYTGVGLIPYFLSYYERRSATEQIANAPHVRDTLEALADAARARKGKSVFVGHSFGGRILELALKQSHSNNPSSGDKLSYPADLTLLINPASEALTAREEILTVPWKRGEPPAIISLKSESDWATGWLWRTAKSLSQLGHHDRYLPRRNGDADTQKRYTIRTAATVDTLLTHKVVPAKPESPLYADIEILKAAASAPSSNAFKANIALTKLRGSQFAFVTGGNGRALQEWEFRMDFSGPFKIAKQYGKDRVYNSLYWIATVPPAILDGHSGTTEEGVFTDNMIDTVAALYNVCRVRERTLVPLPEAKGTPKMLLDAAP